MQLSNKIINSFVAVLLMSASVCNGEDNLHHEISKDQSGVESLSPELRRLLTKEMIALQNGMMSVIPAYASGNWSEIETIGSTMENSYILKQSLSEEQLKELHSLLPIQFIKLDQQFHYYAGMLSHAAKHKKPELVGFYFSKLNESCVSCHSQYATHKFKNFIQPKDADKHVH